MRAGQFLFSGFMLSIAVMARAQTGLGVEVIDVNDNRVGHTFMSGSLQIVLDLKGAGLDKVSAARVVVKEAKDDRGNDLWGKSEPRDFQARNVNAGRIDISLKQPARAARFVQVKGTVELFTPARDPNAVVKVPKALSSLDKPLSSKGLKAAGITLTPLSRNKYIEARQKQKITEKDIADMRAEGKRRGASEKEIEAMLELAKAFSELDLGEVPEGAVILAGTEKDFDRIHSIEILAPDGKPLNIGGRSTSIRGESGWMTLNPSDQIPDGATMQFTLITEKSRMKVPFDLKNIELP